MSDPLERLRSPSDVGAPSVDTIKGRARQIQRRRYMIVSSSAALVVVLAGVGLFVRTNGPAQQHQTQAGSALTNTTAAPENATGATKAGAPATTASGTEKRVADSSSYGAASSGDTAPMVAQSAPNALDAQLILKKHSPGRGEDLTLKVCNNDGASVSRDFGTTQRYDFEVSRGKTVVWKWSKGQAFGQVVGTETWKSHECKTWTQAWDGMDDNGAPVTPGSYSAVGVLTSSTPQRTKPVGFCLDVC